MRRRVAFSILLTALVSGPGAAVSVVSAWLDMPNAPDTMSPPMWAARAYLMHFDLWALATFLPSLIFCHWFGRRPDLRSRTSAGSGGSSRARMKTND